jgi:hypothetical protein
LFLILKDGVDPDTANGCDETLGLGIYDDVRVKFRHRRLRKRKGRKRTVYGSVVGLLARGFTVRRPCESVSTPFIVS